MDGYTVTAIRRRKRKQRPTVNGPTDIARLLLPLVREDSREQFYSVNLSTKNHVISIELIAVGSLSATIVHPREVFRTAIIQSAAAIVVAHSHPSGVSTPSPEDVDFTTRLINAGNILGIRVLDHVVLGDDYTSLRESSLCSFTP